MKKVFLKISQYSHWNTCVGVSFNKVAGLKACNFNKRRLQNRCFLVNIAKFLRAPILKNICEWLLLNPTTNLEFLASQFIQATPKNKWNFSCFYFYGNIKPGSTISLSHINEYSLGKHLNDLPLLPLKDFLMNSDLLDQVYVGTF